MASLPWRHSKRPRVSNHRQLHFFIQPFGQARIKQNIKALRNWALWGESTGDLWFPLTKGK